ncbi:MAG: TonB-dependent receptor [Bacteroidia bacterium]|nr:TonB-dependent receptor [Bacteroidia bacterium]
MTRLSYILAIIFLVSGGQMLAQPGSPLGGKDTLVLENERIEDVIESEKPFEKPPYQQISQGNLDPVRFDAKDFYIGTDFQPAPPDIRPLDKAPKPDYNSNYLRLGIGRYITPIAEIGIYNKDSRELDYGIRFTHRSAHKDKIVQRRFREDYGTVEVSKISRDNVISASASVYNTGYFNYADTVFANNTELREDSLRMGFTDVAFRVGLKRIARNPGEYFLDATAGIGVYLDGRANRESEIILRPAGGYRINENLSANLNTELSLTQGQIGRRGQVRPFIDLNPTLSFVNEKVSLRAGIRFNYFVNSADSTSEVVNLGPDINLDFAVVPEVLTAFGGYTAGVSKNPYQDLIFENRYLGPSANIRATVETMHLYAGIKGVLDNKLDYSARVFYRRVLDQLVYITEDDVYFRPVYDSLTTHAGLHGEVGYQVTDALQAGGAITYTALNTTNADGLTPKLFNVSPLRIEGFAAYRWEDKLTARAGLLLYGPAPMKVDENDEIITRNIFPSVIVNADYRITDNFSVFVRVNNLLNINYQRWYNYPERNLDFLAGILLAF